MHGNKHDNVHIDMHGNARLIVQCTLYKIVLQRHSPFEKLTATVELNVSRKIKFTFKTLVIWLYYCGLALILLCIVYCKIV